MSDIRVRDEQGNIHVFPDGSTPEQIAQAMHVSVAKPSQSGDAGFQMSAGQPRTGVRGWMQDLEEDLSAGGGRTLVGRMMGRMQGRSDGYTGLGPTGEKLPFVNAPLGVARYGEAVAHGADIARRDFSGEEVPMRERVRDLNKQIGGAAQAATPLALAQPEMLPAFVPSLASGGTTQALATKVASSLGADPDTSDLVGNVATAAAPAAARGVGRFAERNAYPIARTAASVLPLAGAAEEAGSGRLLSAMNTAAWGTYFAPRIARAVAPAVRGSGSLMRNMGEVMAPWRHVSAPGAPEPMSQPNRPNPIISSGETPIEGEYVNDWPPKRLPPDMTWPNDNPVNAPGGFDTSAQPALPSARGRKLSTVTPFTKRLATEAPFPPEGDTELYHGTPMGNLPNIGREGLKGGVGRDQNFLTRDPYIAKQLPLELRGPQSGPNVVLSTSVPESAITPVDFDTHPESINQPGVFGHEGEFQSVTTPSRIPPNRLNVRDVAFHDLASRALPPAPELQWPAEYQGAPRSLDASGEGGANYSAEDLDALKARHGIDQPTAPQGAILDRGEPESEIEMLRRGSSEPPKKLIDRMAERTDSNPTDLENERQANPEGPPIPGKGPGAMLRKRSMVPGLNMSDEEIRQAYDEMKSRQPEHSPLFHGTSFENGPSIRRGGLKPLVEGGEGPFATSDEELAAQYAGPGGHIFQIKPTEAMIDAASDRGGRYGDDEYDFTGQNITPDMATHYRTLARESSPLFEGVGSGVGLRIGQEVNENQSLLDKIRADLEKHGQSAESGARKMAYMGSKSGYDPVLPTGQGGYQTKDGFVDLYGRPVGGRTLYRGSQIGELAPESGPAWYATNPKLADMYAHNGQNFGEPRPEGSVVEPVSVKGKMLKMDDAEDLHNLAEYSPEELDSLTEELSKSGYIGIESHGHTMHDSEYNGPGNEIYMFDNGDTSPAFGPKPERPQTLSDWLQSERRGVHYPETFGRARRIIVDRFGEPDR